MRHSVFPLEQSGMSGLFKRGGYFSIACDSFEIRRREKKNMEGKIQGEMDLKQVCFCLGGDLRVLLQPCPENLICLPSKLSFYRVLCVISLPSWEVFERGKGHVCVGVADDV